MEERLQIGANEWRKGLFEERSMDTDGDQQMQNHNWSLCDLLAFKSFYGVYVFVFFAGATL